MSDLLEKRFRKREAEFAFQGASFCVNSLDISSQFARRVLMVRKKTGRRQRRCTGIVVIATLVLDDRIAQGFYCGDVGGMKRCEEVP